MNLLKIALSQMLAKTDRKLVMIDEKLDENLLLKKDQQPVDHSTKSSNISSEPSSLTSSSANSPGVNQMQSPSPLLSSSSSTSSSTSSIFTKEQPSTVTQLRNGITSSKPASNPIQINTTPVSEQQPVWVLKKDEQDAVVLPMLNNEGNVKKIISRFLSQAPNSKNNNFGSFQQQQQHQNVRPSNTLINNANVNNTNKESDCTSSSSGSTLLTITSKSTSSSQDSFKPLPSTKCIYYTEKSQAPFMTTIFKR